MTLRRSRFHGHLVSKERYVCIRTCIRGSKVWRKWRLLHCSHTVCRVLLQIVQSLQPYEVQRQEYIKELVYTERTHVHKLKTMKYVSLYCSMSLYNCSYSHCTLPLSYVCVRCTRFP